MKKNGNNNVVKDYYVGLDIGTNSVGFATTDTMYNLLKHSGKAMWGVRLFDEGETAQARRVNRTNRRRLARRNQRLELLKMLFDKEITRVDDGFFMRLKESFLCLDEKSNGLKYSLFADEDFTDKDYMKKYATIYHLRQELIDSCESHDVRLVYLAVRHIIKNRGHFLFDVDGENSRSFNSVFEDLITCLKDVKDIEIDINADSVHEIASKKASKMDRVKEFASLVTLDDATQKKALEKLFALIIGGTAKLSDIFETDEKTSISFDMGDEKLLEVEEKIDGDFDLLLSAKAVYDCLILEKITRGHKTLSSYKIAEYNQHKEDIKLLKDFIKEELQDKSLYREVFKLKKDKLTNYSAYSGYKKSDAECHCTQAEFCKYLRGKLPKEYENSEKYGQMYKRISEDAFAPKLRKTENGVIPNGLHRSELVAILKNASTYLSFLNEADQDGITVKDKIISIFDYRIPYYVGPLKNKWAVKNEDGIIYPWNFEKKVNLEESAEKFITEMTSMCTYTAEDVLPKNSLLYSEFEVLNEINNLKINGKSITVECKKEIFNHLFLESNKKVTNKSLKTFLCNNGFIKPEDEISGIDDTVKSQLSSYHKMKNIIEKTSYDQAEEIIRRIVLFGDDKKLLRRYLEKNTSLSQEDIAYVLKLKFKDWGRFSRKFLSGIQSVNKETGEIVTIIEMLRESNLNLMQLLSKEFTFKEEADKCRNEKLGVVGSIRDAVDNLYVSPKIRRGIWQTLRILDEIVDIEKGAPKKIFIEMARENESDEKKKQMEGKRKSRKEQLIALYKECNEAKGDLFKKLVDEDEDKLNSKKLYLYYMQFGKCMYSGDPIEISELENKNVFDIDHIFPRSKIKDDSFDNLVLVKAELNREKTNTYPISNDIREKMKGKWNELKRKGLISESKYNRLTRNTPLTADELAQFVNRQLVETRQSTKAVAELINVIYPKTQLIYSKAGNVSHFRNYFKFTKCRDINDHHHAKDAYLNIVVGNFNNVLYSAEFIQGLNAGKNSIRDEVIYNHNLKGTWQSGENGTIATVRKTMSKNNILFTVMPKEEHGQLFDVTIMKKEKGQVPIKNGLDISKYGGYNKASGAYFAIVEHEEKGKQIRTIEAVLKHQKVEYETNPQEFARKHWYKDSKIIKQKILFNSVFEIDGVRLAIRKRQNEHIGFIHLYQLALNEDDYEYVRRVCKFVDTLRDKSKDSSKGKGYISKERNEEIFDNLIEKIRSSIYFKLFSGIVRYAEENREKFSTLSLEDQCITVREILNLFRCNPVLTSLAILCGKGNVGAILKNKKISDQQSVYLINQSVTGIFETRIDLLK